MSAFFVVFGPVCGLIYGTRPNDICNQFVDGCKMVVRAVILIGLAYAISVVLKNGNPYVPDIRLKDRDGGKRHGDAALAAVLACYAVSECAASPAPMFYSAKNQTEKKSIWDKLPWK